jgi:hypothetical protein
MRYAMLGTKGSEEDGSFICYGVIKRHDGRYSPARAEGSKKATPVMLMKSRVKPLYLGDSKEEAFKHLMHHVAKSADGLAFERWPSFLVGRKFVDYSPQDLMKIPEEGDGANTRQ